MYLLFILAIAGLLAYAWREDQRRSAMPRAHDAKALPPARERYGVNPGTLNTVALPSAFAPQRG